ncbi:MAG TPA: LptF/LptG family permease [Fluviicola sp.]|nr:LptF/LptG family permease [Fluviicola sp.]
MITKIDKYIIRKFLSTFFFMLGIIMLLSMVFDISEKLGDFIDNQAPVSGIIFKYYVNFLLFYGNTFSSLIVFISVIWFTAKMAQDSEIIPILFSGRPFTRFIRPYIIASTLLMFISLILNHFILPRSNKVRLDFEESFYRDRLVVEDYHAEFPGHESVHYTSFLAETNNINDLVIEKFDDQNRLIHFLKARTARYNDTTKKWQLTDVFERRVHYIDSISPEDDRVNSVEFLTEKHQKDTLFQFKVEDIAVRDNVIGAMTYTELKEYIRKERLKGNPNLPSFEIELYQRTSYPFATYVLTMIGVSVSSRKKRGGIGINIAIGLMFVFLYIFSMKVTTVAALNVGFPPMLAVWIPNLIFAVFAVLLYRFAPK